MLDFFTRRTQLEEARSLINEQEKQIKELAENNTNLLEYIRTLTQYIEDKGSLASISLDILLSFLIISLLILGVVVLVGSIVCVIQTYPIEYVLIH